jgi:hypothetical protein
MAFERHQARRLVQHSRNRPEKEAPGRQKTIVRGLGRLGLPAPGADDGAGAWPSGPAAAALVAARNRLRLADGRQLAVPLAYFPRLLSATPQQRMKFELSGGGTGIHWIELDEDISVAGLLMGYGDKAAHL